MKKSPRVVKSVTCSFPDGTDIDVQVVSETSNHVQITYGQGVGRQVLWVPREFLREKVALGQEQTA